MVTQIEMINLGLMSYFLSIEVKQTDKRIFISQNKYAGNILRKIKIEVCKPMLKLIEEMLKFVKDRSSDLVDAINIKRLVGNLRYL